MCQHSPSRVSIKLKLYLQKRKPKYRGRKKEDPHEKASHLPPARYCPVRPPVQASADISGHRLWRDGSTAHSGHLPSFSLKPVQLGNIVSGAWISGHNKNIRDPNNEISNIYEKGQMRCQIRDGRLTPEYRTETGQSVTFIPPARNTNNASAATTF